MASKAAGNVVLCGPPSRPVTARFACPVSNLQQKCEARLPSSFSDGSSSLDSFQTRYSSLPSHGQDGGKQQHGASHPFQARQGQNACEDRSAKQPKTEGSGGQDASRIHRFLDENFGELTKTCYSIAAGPVHSSSFRNEL